MLDQTYQTVRLSVYDNPVAKPGGAYPSSLQPLFNDGIAQSIRKEISDWPGYAPTPLVSLNDMTDRAGVGAIWYKDESPRFGLRSFKALGGAYAVDQLLLREIEKRRPGEPVSAEKLHAGAYRDDCANITIATATDGNHGRSVAWGAQRRGCPCMIYIHAGVSEGRENALASFGAKVIRVAGNYDDSVHQTAKDAEENGWFVVSDTSYEGYVDPPTDVMRGYTVMTAEIVDQLPAPPTHVFVQGGVGGLAAAVIGHLWDVYGANRPRFIIVEPETADCLYQSAKAGHPVAVEGDLETIMAGLSCGEVSTLAWPVVQAGTDHFLIIDDAAIPQAMRDLARRDAGAIEAGESAVAGLVALLALGEQPDLKARLSLDTDSRILLLGTEGATDPHLYETITKHAG
ncbi:MAG: diaminopropionate ammonia-lyase [Henriciella sp.]|nr:diaminopropionate ammonia-lyase [Henriciella sp.]